MLKAAKREFFEETGIRIEGDFKPLIPVKQKSGKIVHAFAVEFDIDETKVKSNLFSMEWPPRSGKYVDVPEIDRCEWFTSPKAKEKIIAAQAAFIDQLIEELK